jgi:hypothetical protein
VSATKILRVRDGQAVVTELPMGPAKPLPGPTQIVDALLDTALERIFMSEGMGTHAAQKRLALKHARDTRLDGWVV